MSFRTPCFTIVTVALLLTSTALAFADAPAELDRFEDVESHRVRTTQGVVAADHRIASEAGAEALAQGGTAADAGVVAMLTLGVTNPFASGLGGGGFCLYRPADTGQTEVLDFRETAPAAAHRDLYRVDGEVDHQLARQGGLANGVPGEPAGLWALHGRYGELAWEDVVEPSRRLADQGFPVGEKLATYLQDMADEFENWPELAAIFQNEEGQYLAEGDLMVRDDLVRALTLLRDEGVRPFYVGPIADAIAEASRAHGGVLTSDDLAAYALRSRQPVVATFEDYEIHAMPPPSSGGIALAQALQIVAARGIGDDPGDADTMHTVVEALKHAFADRARWLGDTDFVDVPTERLLSPEYAAERAEQIDPDAVLPTEAYGTVAPDADAPGTSHLSVADAQGNLLACTTTVNTRFGSLVHVPEYGIILNNEMADFSVEPGEPNIFGLVGNEQNAVAAGKRPLSSMSPTLVTRNGEPYMTLGASGGPTIITGVYLTLLNLIAFDRSPLEAVAAPRIHHQWIPESLFVEREGQPYADGLRRRGHDLQTRRAYNAVQLIVRDRQHWIGVSDPRKGGRPAAADSSAAPASTERP